VNGADSLLRAKMRLVDALMGLKDQYFKVICSSRIGIKNINGIGK